MKKLLMAGIAVAALGGAPALAADMPVKAAPAAYDPWTGCYLGANVGGAWADVDHTWTLSNGAPTGVNSPLVRQTPSGAVYGGQIGCDYQFNNSWVVGIRGMWDGANLKATDPVGLPNIGNFLGQTYTTKIQSFETLTVRLGVLASPTAMFYGIGGVAWMQDRFAVANPPTALLPGTFTAAHETRTGYDIGAGLSWMFAPNWDFWLEYDHMGFGNHIITTPANPFFIGNPTTGFAEKENIDKVLVGIDYRFHSGR